jgi:glutamate formiminotransferase/glutamate formiminotransferase/formiminotetrahydrofolate cyclodeaminase
VTGRAATADPRLLAVPNISEGRDAETIAAVGRALVEGGAQLLDTHTDPDHNRTVFSLAGLPGVLSGALLAGAAEAVARIDLSRHAGVHPRIGAIDVAPIVFRTEAQRGAASAEALVLADMLGQELSLPVFLYGLLTDGRRTRAEVRRGGLAALQGRIEAGEQLPDFGPSQLHVTAGAVLVGARRPLLAFNVELAPPATLDDALEIAARIREGGAEGLPSVRAIGVWLAQRNVAQVSTNVEDHRATNLADVVAVIARHAEPARAELVGLAPAAAFEGFPTNLPLANRRVLEEALSLRPVPAAS